MPRLLKGYVNESKREEMILKKKKEKKLNLKK